jgi:hypothetical protein
MMKLVTTNHQNSGLATRPENCASALCDDPLPRSDHDHVEPSPSVGMRQTKRLGAGDPRSESGLSAWRR